jgi:hypothetical protein
MTDRINMNEFRDYLSHVEDIAARLQRTLTDDERKELASDGPSYLDEDAGQLARGVCAGLRWAVGTATYGELRDIARMREEAPGPGWAKWHIHDDHSLRPVLDAEYGRANLAPYDPFVAGLIDAAALIYKMVAESIRP